MRRRKPIFTLLTGSWRPCCRWPNRRNAYVPGLTLATLKRIGKLMSDTEAARRMQKAKHRPFEQLRNTA